MHQSNIDKKAINPIFSSIRMVSTSNELRIISTDGQKALEHILQEKFEDFDYILNGAVLYELLKKSKSQLFKIQETFESYKLQIGSAEFKFSKYAQQDQAKYPEWKDEYKFNFKIDAKAFANALKLVKWSCANDESRPFLNGVCIEVVDGGINLCATDGLRLALQKLSSEIAFKGRWILSKRSVFDLVKTLEECPGEVEFYFGKYIKVVHEKKDKKTIWQSLLVAGTFPDYQRIIPASFVASFIADAKEILDTVDRIMVMANQTQPTITLKFSNEGDKKSKISAENSLSSGEDVLEGEYNGQPIQLLLNGKFLQEMLMNLEGKLVFEITDTRSPLVVKNIENNGSLFIIAPVKKNTTI
jgi:DNA polymerase-3 subunit beta